MQYKEAESHMCHIRKANDDFTSQFATYSALH